MHKNERILPGRIFWVFLFLLCVGSKHVLADDAKSCVYQPSAADAGSGPHVSEPLKHGINLSRWWQDDQDRPLSAKDIQRIRDSGFDFVRLPVSPTWLEIKDPEEQSKKLEALNCDIISLLNESLNVVLDLHGSEAFQAMLAQNPNAAVPRLEDAWRKLQSIIAALPHNRIFLGLYNEPLIESDLWWRLQGRMMDDLRPLFSDNTFVLSSGPFNGWWNLTNKKPYDDPNIIYDFHLYEPMVFTHHGAEWLKDGDEDKTFSPITYPVTKTFHFDMNDPAIKKYVDQNWGRASIFKILEDIAAWRDFHRVRVACLEFGVYRAHVDDQSRDNWLHDVHDGLQKAHMPWAVWEYRGPFGLLDKQGELDKDMLSALGLKYSQIP